MNQLVAQPEDMMNAMRTSIYPGAADKSIHMVLAYCRTAGLDPIQKPVHIVNMSVKQANGKYEHQDVIMPGIGLYRIQANRTGEYAGMSDPEFGEMVSGEWTDKDGNLVCVRYPDSCRITVYRLVQGVRVEFSAIEYWEENYATQGWTSCPNAMWRKRPRGQLAKCAEAQALRRAFPELGSAYTAEEMDGKTIGDGQVIESELVESKPAIEAPQRKSTTKGGTKKKTAAKKKANNPDEPINGDQLKWLDKNRESAGVTEVALLEHFEKSAIDEFTAGDLDDVLAWFREVKESAEEEA